MVLSVVWKGRQWLSHQQGVWVWRRQLAFGACLKKVGFGLALGVGSRKAFIEWLGHQREVLVGRWCLSHW